MNTSAGLAFAPHVISVGAGEVNSRKLFFNLKIDLNCSFSLYCFPFIFLQDIVSKVLSFSQQRPRALCIMSGTGTVSSVTLRQPASTAPSLTFEVSKSLVQLTDKNSKPVKKFITFLCVF